MCVYIYATVDWILNIEANGEGSEKMLKDSVPVYNDFGKDRNISSPFKSQTKLLKSHFKDELLTVFVLKFFL